MFSKSHNFSFPLLFVGLILGFCCPSVIPCTQDAIRIDVPTEPRVRIENRFGQVAAEVWREKYVSVSATVESSGAVFKRSPVVIERKIERKSQLLLISVIRRPTDPEAQISLAIKLPESAHAEILTSIGSITMRGSLASASLKSESGDIRAELAIQSMQTSALKPQVALSDQS